MYIDVNENECVNIGLRLRSNNNGTYNPAHLLPVGSKTAFKYSRNVAAVSAPGSFICALPAWGDAFSSVSPCAPQVMKSYWAKFPTVLRSVAKELNAKAKGKYRFQLESADLKRLQPWLAKQVVRVCACMLELFGILSSNTGRCGVESAPGTAALSRTAHPAQRPCGGGPQGAVCNCTSSGHGQRRMSWYRPGPSSSRYMCCQRNGLSIPGTHSRAHCPPR